MFQKKKYPYLFDQWNQKISSKVIKKSDES